MGPRLKPHDRPGGAALGPRAVRLDSSLVRGARLQTQNCQLRLLRVTMVGSKAVTLEFYIAPRYKVEA
jgi:hypothetical protein